MIIAAGYFVLFFAVQLLLLIRWRTHQHLEKTTHFEPYASLLLAVRNEEANIERCLHALEALDYPKDKLEILIGEDQSTDRTREVLERFCQDKPQYRIIPIAGRLGHARAKANVIAHLAKSAHSNFFLITDADVAVPRNWARTMLSPMQDSKIGAVSGCTTITGSSISERAQFLDWVYSLGLIQVLSELPKPVTALGNNMLVRRQAYESVGGFESIPHSITEDVQLFKYLRKKGWGFRNLYQADTLGWSLPAKGFREILEQRKRWMTGSMHLPWYAVAAFVLHASFYVVLLTSAWTFSWTTMAGLALLKFGLQFLFIRKALKRLKVKGSFLEAARYEIFLMVMALVLIPYYYLPTKINWKGRQYAN